MAQLSGMTGFARAEGQSGEWRFVWECRSVNGKGLEARFRLPHGFDRLEPKARDLAKARFNRGHIQISLNLRRDTADTGVAIDTARIEALLKAAQPYLETGRASRPTFDGLLALGGLAENSEPLGEDDAKALDAALLASLADAFDGLQDARREEGAALFGVLQGHVATIEQLTGEAASCAAARIDAIRDRIAAKFEDLLPEGLPEDRLAMEAAALAVKMDVREEIDRLRAHIDSARDLLAGGSPVGRKLDFLSQEFNREANTLCSKSSDSSLTQIGLALKNAVDQLREQVQNVE